MTNLISKIARNNPGMWGYFWEALGNELKHTGLASVQNVGSDLTFGLVPRADYGINPNDRYLTEGVKDFRRNAQAVAELSAGLAAPIGIVGATGKGLNAAAKGVRAAQAAGTTASKLHRFGNTVNNVVGRADKFLRTPIYRGARVPGYVNPGWRQSVKNVANQLVHDNWWGRAKTVGSIGRRAVDFLYVSPTVRWPAMLAKARTPGQALKNLGYFGVGMEAISGRSEYKYNKSRLKNLDNLYDVKLTPYQMAYLADNYMLSPEDMNFLRQWSHRTNKPWYEHPFFNAAEIDTDKMKSDLLMEANS